MRKDSPYFNNLYSFRFITNEEFAHILEHNGFEISSNEKVGRTYRNGAEYFEFVVIEGLYKG